MNHEKNEERFVCVWLDNEPHRSKDSLDAENDLRNIINSFRYYNDLTRCLQCILNIENAKIIFITVDILAEKIIPIIHSSEQIHSIYILYSIEKPWTKDYQKIQGFYNNRKLICQKIEENLIRPKNKSNTGISFISSNDIHSNDLNRQDPSFMYFQLIKEILLNDHLNEIEEETKKDMLTYCRQIYARSRETLDILDEFEQNFIPDLSVNWYTRECFLYKILNTALWTPQPDVLYKLRYFLRHLHQQILSQSKSQRNGRTSVTVYRGQSMSEEQIEKLKQNVGGFLSFNNFLSTSLRRDVAFNFVWGSETGVLFEMFIDSTIEKFPFASIEHLSFQQGQRGESEILFSAGTVFRIVEIDKQTDYYHVQLILSNDIDEQLAEYTKRTREKTRSSYCFVSLLKLMHELCQYDSIDRFSQIFDNDSSLYTDPDILDVIHNLFGLMHNDRGQINDALKHFHKSLSICLITLPADHPQLAVTYNNIGCVYTSQSNHDTALTFYQLALDCQSNSDNPDALAMITYTSNIARVYREQEKFDDALIFYKRALKLQKEYLGENDPSLATIYNMISAVYYQINDYEQATLHHEKAIALQTNSSESNPEASAYCSMTTGGFCLSQGQYSEALQHFKYALKTQQKYFLPNNPSLAVTHSYIAGAYYQQKQFEESLSYHLKALEIEQNSLSDDHPSIATSYFSISKDYAGLSFLSDALEYGLKAIEQIKKSPQTDLDTLATFTDHIGQIYYQRNEYEKALKYYKEALELSLTYLSDDDASLVAIYYRTAETYYKLERYNDALLFYQKTLDIELRTLPDDAKTIATSYSDISASYIGLKRFDEAFIATNQAHEQLLKTLPYNHPEVMQQQEALDKIKMIQILQEEQD